MTELKRILHVEDDEDILMIARLALADLGGFEVMQCMSGPEALEKGAAFGPDLLLLDFMMPEMNGLQTLQALRGQPTMSDVPAIFMTAKQIEVSQAEFDGLGVLGKITKPFDPVALSNDIMRLWATRPQP
ncbi:hypothetical protein C0V75_15770 [Tabrizicola sp. TH137]|uniref:response regulator n=1 Tax=Tabrizicola sp. TH137 TaxID=2067452 RepID=UPI000C7C92D3|nr:response regulator [Tabrizicola sp. TH137]PLL11485.1 hypothetical protein C0V75_15770 [Tabrizicola sp. TH137]